MIKIFRPILEFVFFPPFFLILPKCAMNLHRLSILSFFVVAFFFSCEISVVGCVGKNLELPASSSQPLPGPRSLLDSVKSKITKWRNSTREHQTQRHRRDFFNACRAGKSTKVFQLLNGHHKVHIDQMNDDEKGWSCINYAVSEESLHVS